MRSVFIIYVPVFLFLSCAKKMIPAASVDNKPMVEAKLPDEVKPVITTPVESSMSIAGHAIYDARCGRCHDLKKPAEYMLKQWIPILDRMAPRAGLDSTEKANVLAYVSFNARAEN